MTKKWYQSKILWLNVISLVAVVLQIWSNKEVLSAEAQLSILSLINIILRVITKESIEW